MLCRSFFVSAVAFTGLLLALPVSAQTARRVDVSPTSGYNPDVTFDIATDIPGYGTAALGQADATTGAVGGTLPLVSIGDLSQGGLVYIRDISDPNGRRDNFLGAVEVSDDGDDVVVTALGTPYPFEKSPSGYESTRPNGVTLSKSGSIWTLIDKGGVVFTFDAQFSSDRPIFASGGRLTRVAYPDGTRLDLTYDRRTLCTQSGTSGSSCPVKRLVPRLLSVDSNIGYQIKYEYQTTKPQYGYDDGSHARIVKVTGINKTVEACHPGVNGCSGLGSQWPAVSFSRLEQTATEQITVTDAIGQRTLYRYDSENRLQNVRLPGTSSGWDVTYTYTNGRVSRVTGDPGTWTYSYSTTGGSRRTTITDPSGQDWFITSRTVDRQITEVRDPLGRRTQNNYLSNGLLHETVAPEGNKTVYTYDSRGNVTRISPRDKSGAAYSDQVFVYPSCTSSNRVYCNKPGTIADWRGPTYYNYSPSHGGVSRVRLPDIGQGRKTDNISYAVKTASFKNHSGSTVTSSVVRPIRTQASTGATIDYKVDGGSESNLLIEGWTVSGAGVSAATTRIGHDQLGNVEYTDGPLHGTADRNYVSYDALRRPVVSINPSPSGTNRYPATKTVYDTTGRISAVQSGYATGPNAFNSFVAREVQQNTYDARGRLVRQSGSFAGQLHQAVDYSYDAVGREKCVALRMSALSSTRSACSVTNGAFGPDRVTRRTYDVAGRVTTVTNGYGTSAARSEQIGYTTNGLTAWIKDGEGNRTAFEYDGRDRRTKVRYPTAANGSSTSGSDYDLYGYDANGLLTWHRKRDGQTINYGYDGLGRMTSLNAPGTTEDISMSYDVHGRLKSAVMNGRTLSYDYDVLSQLKKEVGPNGATQYQYDSAGRRTQMNYPGAGAFYVTYEWGAAGELKKIREKGNEILATFAYDELGRRKSLTRGNGVVTSYGFDAARLSDFDVEVPGSSAYDILADFEHNPAGQISRETHFNSAFADTPRSDELAFQVNGRNQYTTMSKIGGVLDIAYDARGNLTNDGVEGYGYDVLNRLTSVTKGSNTTTLSYDAAGRLAQEVASVTRKFAYDGRDLISEFDFNGGVTDRYVHGPGSDEPLVWYRGSERRYLSADERGSVVLVTRSNGSVLRRNQYDTDGQAHWNNLGRFGYTGQTKITNTDVWHYKARAYSPRLARFLQTDPIGYGDGLNWYAYVGSDSLNNVDPTGTETCDVTNASSCVDEIIAEGTRLNGGFSGGGQTLVGPRLQAGSGIGTGGVASSDGSDSEDGEGDDCNELLVSTGNAFVQFGNLLTNVGGSALIVGSATIASGNLMDDGRGIFHATSRGLRARAVQVNGARTAGLGAITLNMAPAFTTFGGFAEGLGGASFDNARTGSSLLLLGPALRVANRAFRGSGSLDIRIGAAFTGTGLAAANPKPRSCDQE